jgi:hypothetical protein
MPWSKHFDSNYNLLKEFILCIQILLFYTSELPKYFDVIDQKNKWSIVTLEIVLKPIT